MYQIFQTLVLVTILSVFTSSPASAGMIDSLQTQTRREIAYCLAHDTSLCSSYCAKARELDCQRDTYLLRFGYHYCRRFLDVNSHFSPFAQGVLKGIRSCLVKNLKENSKLTCDNVEESSEQQHVACYVESGFCELNPIEQTHILWNILPEVGKPGFQSVAFQVLGQCTQRWGAPADQNNGN